MSAAGAYFEDLGGGRFKAAHETMGPWDRDAQHGGPPSALLTRCMRHVAGEGGLRASRISCELLRPVPVDEVEVEVDLVRPGRNVRLVDAVLRAGGEPAMLARAWFIAPAPAEPGEKVRDPAGVPPATDPDTLERSSIEGEQWQYTDGYLKTIDWRQTEGGFHELGAGMTWGRPLLPLIAGEELHPVERAMLIADSGSGIGLSHDLRSTLAINVDLTLFFDRDPGGEWIHLAAETTGVEGGASYSTTVLSDRDGRFARGVQTLLVRPQT